MKRDRENPAPALVAADDDAQKVDGDDSCHCEFGEASDKGDDSVGVEDEGDDEDISDLENDDPTDIDIERVRRGIANFICFQDVPPNLLKNDDFKNLMTEYFPSLTLDSETTKNDCLKVFEEAKSITKCTLNHMGRMIPLSVDVLTYLNRHGSRYDYISLAAHFVDDTWKLRKWILYFRRLDFFDAAILKSIDDWSLENKVYTLTSGNINAFARDEIIESIKSQFKEKNRLPIDSRLFSVSCCAEMFCLMAQDAFEEICIIIGKLKELHLSRSESMWHTTNWKLKIMLDMESMGEFNSDVHKNFVPSADEWEKVRIVYKLVDNTYNVAKQVFETKHPTANKFLYNLEELRAKLILEATSSVSFTWCVAKKMLQRLDKYIKETFLVLAIASVMDPRCKMQYMEYISTKFGDRDGILESGAVLEAIKSIYADYASHGTKVDNSEGTSNLKTEEGNPRNDKEQFPNFPGGQEYHEYVQVNNKPKKSDLDSYLEEPVVPWNENFNVLRWWKSEAPKYPNVSKMARDFLAIPISVATSHDAYYYLENRPPDLRVITSGAEMMNALMCCRSWNTGPKIDFELWFLAAGVNIL
ncbi:zinc finger BED domain-containing protein RICESLEEPER 1-like [Olea europaea var. sylvestris]|uniref:zinc finger BED domain-containing protein RICESLEEPER 1-like n=1 Tax=Olea europaea var. sylvestris TaxID=158386 RepID=UPI000C1D579E|nr:zinc finger BED domain-containing protein RICESLEEPER 1-like [Olea europaea var. sylvestris]